MATKKKKSSLTIPHVKDHHFDHVRSELKELGMVINKAFAGYYVVYPAVAKSTAVKKKLTITRKELYEAWEAGKELVALLAGEFVKHLEHFEKRGKK